MKLYMFCFVLTRRRHPIASRPDTLVPYTTICLSEVTRCDLKAVSTLQAGCEKPIVEQIGGVERKAPTVPVNLGKRIYGRARRRDDRIERAGGNGRIDPIRIKGAGRFALAAINNAGSQAQLRLVRQAEGLGRPYRRHVAWHIVEAAVHLRGELIITVRTEEHTYELQSLLRTSY